MECTDHMAAEPSGSNIASQEVSAGDKKSVQQMTLAELREELAKYKANGKGTMEELRRRVEKVRVERPLVEKSHETTEGTVVEDRGDSSKMVKSQPYEYYMVFDVEATCVENRNPGFRNEIIEFPVVMVDSRTGEVVDEFHSYVRPVLNPVLSEFCTKLTGIQQSDVDGKPAFPRVLDLFENWLQKHSLLENTRRWAFVTDGPWDIRNFVRSQCELSRISRPAYFNRWVDLRLAFHACYNTPRKLRLNTMLGMLGMTFEGREHSGICDSRNIARIAIRMMKDGHILKCNGSLR